MVKGCLGLVAALLAVVFLTALSEDGLTVAVQSVGVVLLLPLGLTALWLYLRR